MKKLTFSLIALTCFFNTQTFAGGDKPNPTGVESPKSLALVPYTGPKTPSLYTRTMPFPWDMLAMKSALAPQMPGMLGGYDAFQLDIMPFAQTFRQNLARDENDAIMNNLLPHALKARAYVERMVSTYPKLRFFLAEIDFKIAAEAIDPTWLEFLGMRIAAAMSDEPNPEALTLFSDFGGNEVDAFMRKNYKTEVPSRTFFEEKIEGIDDEDDGEEPEEATTFVETATMRVEKGEFGYTTPEYGFSSEYVPASEAPYSPTVDTSRLYDEGVITVTGPYHPKPIEKISDKTWDAIDDILSHDYEEIHIPLYGRGKMGLAPLIEAFNNSVYPYGVSARTNTAHGLTMTPFLFAFHDWLHGESDEGTKNKAINGYISDKAFALAKEYKLDVNIVALEVAKEMRAKSDLLIRNMNRLLDNYFKHYAITGDEMFLKKALVGFFIMIHEEFELESDHFNTKRFKAFITKLSDEACDSLQEINEDDDYRITNETSFTADATAESDNAYKIKRARDDIGLLRMVGISIEEPTFTGDFETDKPMAETYLKSIQVKMLECVAFFTDTARYLIDHDAELGDGFTDKVEDIEEALTARLEALKPAEEE